ncbi:MAG: tRNA epoxyqueuosine(34) reductase QueG [Planctomycetales bacterium]|nr:tRNA epoxyqueuosine(34) reductase QueG [Planctomycetales bacterium]
MNSRELTSQLKARAGELGFALSGSCPAVEPTGILRFREWLERGYAGQMQYLPDRAAAYEHPRSVLDGVRSLLMLAMPYRTSEPRTAESGKGRISRYAWGPRDYHDVIHERLKQLAAWLRAAAPDASVRGVVDSAPLLERDFARLAGLGWIGKHTLLIHRSAGSYFFLAALLTDVELAYDQPFAADHCGSCRACLDACPTQAFPQPYVLDATRCISYLTIELRDEIPRDLRDGVGEWLFGCDVCQDVCPWNRKSPVTDEREFVPRPDCDPVELSELFELDDAGFRERFRRTPMWRTKRRGLLRNAAIVLGNQRAAGAVAPLSRGLHDAEPLIRSASAWALGRIATPAALAALIDRASREVESSVLEEIAIALRTEV